MRKNILKVGFFLIGLIFMVEMIGQTPDSLPNSPFQRARSGSVRLSDSANIAPPTLNLTDSLRPKSTFQIKINNDALDAAVEYSAEDSMFFDLKNKQLHLWGKATMKYTSIDLKSDYIVLDYGKSEVTALQRMDSVTLRKLGDKPQFKDGDQDFTAKQLKYNFKSQKGIVYEARTLQEQLYVVGEKAKFVSQKTSDTTTLTTIYNKDAILTTCDADHPHYGIKATKLKVIPDKLIVVGPSNLQIAGIPTPLVLPFGFFPVSKTRKQGLLLPRDFDYDPIRGLGFQNIGYYLPINENMDATMFVEWYLRGTWGARTDWKYNYKYKYSGQANLGYRDNVTENNRAEKVHARSWLLTWSHTQDSRAHPTRNFGGSVNIQTNGFQKRNQNDYASVHQNTLSSNLNFRKTFPGKPYQFSASMRHSQNTLTREMNVNLPTVDFQMNRIYPFKNKKRIGEEKWFEKTSLVYNSRLANEFRTRDDSLMAPGGFRRAWETKKFGVEHRVSSDVQLDVLKYFKFSPNISYTEAWYLNKIEKTFDPRPIFTPREAGISIDPISGDTFPKFQNDTTSFGQVKKRTINEFTPYREFSVGAGLNTVLFGTKQFKKGFLRGIRHKMVPSIGFSYVPYLGGNYVDSVQTDTRLYRTDKQKYTVLDDQSFLRPSTSGRTSSSLNFSLGNTLEAKYWSKKDSATKKFTILRSLNFSGSYNLTADSLNWSQISTGANFPIFKSLSNLNIGLAFDPYITENNRRVQKFAYKERGKLLTMPRLTASLNTGLSIKQIRDILKGEQKDPQNTASQPANAVILDDFWSVFDNFNISHSFGAERRLLQNGRDTFVVSLHSIDTRGNINLTSKWSLNVGHIGYDFKSKRISYPDFGFTRDMHCWQMSFSWQPTRGTYNFFLSVKPGSVLDFLKVPFKKTYPDPRVF
jgi:DNA-binding transcriptional MerR regulator